MHRSLVIVSLAALIAFQAGPAAAAKGAAKSISLIVDASGSMRAKLSSGQHRIDAAKDAVKNLVGGLPGDLRLSLRAYGHQSHRREKNCQDTQLLTPFRVISENRSEVIRKTNALKAQGYTPISLVLEQSANALKSESGSQSRVVILVSDGKETCEGDPCAVAKALSAADANLVVHTIGFAVDVAARYQLQCIARVGRGTYFEADTTDKLAERLSTAVKTVAIKAPAKIKSKSEKPGVLRLKNPSASRHEVIRVKTGKVEAHLSSVISSAPLPAGFYNVKFGNSLWRSIEIKNGEATEIETAIIDLPNASYSGHEILDWETQQVIGKLSSMRTSMNLMPSSYLVRFGTRTLAVNLVPGARKVIDVPSVSFDGLPVNSRSILDENGKEVITVSSLRSSATLLPGKYVLDLYETKVPFELKPGQNLTVNIE